MDYSGYRQTFGSPFRGKDLVLLMRFLESCGLTYDESIEHTIAIWDSNDRIIATGSLDGNVIKCVATSSGTQGEGLCATVVSHLVSYAAASKKTRLFVYTKPENRQIFTDLGFYLIGETAKAILLESRRDGIKSFIAGLERHPEQGTIGAIVANCNPFTNGHLYLAEQAAKACDFVYFFLLSEDRSAFPADVRFRLARVGLAHLKNVTVYPTDGYMVSSATFPAYFLKEKANCGNVASQLDLDIFCRHFVPALGISVRFVGEEPFCRVTSSYNEQMKAILPQRGVRVVEIPRREVSEQAISASRVRALAAEQRYEEIRPLVPETTYQFLLSPQGREIAMRIAENKRIIE